MTTISLPQLFHLMENYFGVEAPLQTSLEEACQSIQPPEVSKPAQLKSHEPIRFTSRPALGGDFDMSVLEFQ